MFIMPVTVPLNWPPTSMGTAQAGPMTNSRKKNEMARNSTEAKALCVIAAGITKTPASRKPGAATMRRANLASPVRLKKRSLSEPPVTSPEHARE